MRNIRKTKEINEKDTRKTRRDWERQGKHTVALSNTRQLCRNTTLSKILTNFGSQNLYAIWLSHTSFEKETRQPLHFGFYDFSKIEDTLHFSWSTPDVELHTLTGCDLYPMMIVAKSLHEFWTFPERLYNKQDLASCRRNLLEIESKYNFFFNFLVIFRQ